MITIHATITPVPGTDDVKVSVTVEPPEALMKFSEVSTTEIQMADKIAKAIHTVLSAQNLIRTEPGNWTRN